MGAISVRNVSFSYSDAVGKPVGGDVTEKLAGSVKPNGEDGLACPKALDGIDLEIPDGQFLCLIGHSGSGKSTLLRLLVGLSKPTSGQIVIDGKLVEGCGLDRSFVFQNYSLFPWMRVHENVAFGVEQANKELGRGLSKTEVSRIARDYLVRVGMAEAAEKYPYQLSGGMQQRVAIARALAMDTEIVLFDEPFGALDVRTRRSLQSLVDELWRAGDSRKTVVFVTHDISEAILLADRVVFMEHGRIAADMSIDIERPRSVADVMSKPAAVALRERMTALFYRDAAACDERGGEEPIDMLLEAL